MNVKLFIGIVLFIIGLATAVVGIAGVATPGPGAVDQPVVSGSESQPPAISESATTMVVPFVAAICLAVGGLLIGISVGNWKHPRTELKPGDEVVNPEGYHKMKHV